MKSRITLLGIIVALVAVIAMPAFGGTTTGTGSLDFGICPADHEMHDGEVFDAEDGCNIKGDIEIWWGHRWVSYHDDKDNTGTIVHCWTMCKVRSPHGANVTPRHVRSLINEMLQSGCIDGCDVVYVYPFPQRRGFTKPVAQ